jgi:serine protease Do
MTPMPPRFARARFTAAVAGAFLGGLIVASGLDLTPFGHAQSAAKPSAQDVKPLVETGNAFISIAEHVTPAVVSIQTTREARARSRTRSRGAIPPGFEQFFDQLDPQRQQPQENAGSGFIVSKDGYILTNNHVVEDADRVTVTLADHRVFRAKVIGNDPTTDVALIKIEGRDLPSVPLGDDGKVRIGEWVVAIGNPLGLDFTVTAGIVSAKGRGSRDLRGLMGGQYAISDFIQTDAAINPGNSGGPLVNIRGEVIGINSAIASPTGYYSGYGFAIPVTLAKDVMDDLIAYGKVRRPVLGIGINDVQPEDAAVAGLKTIAGVRVDAFNPPDDSPAKVAGMQAGDIITAIDGKQVDRVSTLQRVVRGYEPGQSVKVDVMRYGKPLSFRVKLVEAEEEPARVASADDEDERAGIEGIAYGKIGVRVEPLSPEFIRTQRIDEDMRGLRVTEVSPTGPARDRLASSDVIVEVIYPTPRRPVRTVADLQAALASAKSGDYISLHVYSLAARSTRVVNLRVD